MFLAVFECIGLMWVYGYDNFAFDVYYMLERKLGFYWKLTWKFTAPVVLGFIIVASFIDYQPLHYGTYDYPAWADVVGWLLTLLILLQIPAWAIYAVVTQRKGGSLLEVRITRLLFSWSIAT